jgi:uncharacterized protein
MGDAWPDHLVDADGHVIEDLSAIREYLPERWQRNVATRALGVFPGLDHLHHYLATSPDGAFNPTGFAEWVAFLDALQLDAAVLFPTRGLAFGTLTDAELAVGTAMAYNDWLSDAYTKLDPRLKGIGLIPVQDPEAAADELRRMVNELGFVGALLPARGLKSHHGDPMYWPIYEEADRLGCALAVHGGVLSGMGFDQFNVFAASHALGHPFSIAIAFSSMVSNSIFDRFPSARFGFLEGGAGWFVTVLERLSGSFEAFVPYESRQDVPMLGKGESVADYVLRHTREGRVFVGVEGEEPVLPWAVRNFGAEPFVFSSDFPHEVNIGMCRHEVEELAASSELNEKEKEAIFSLNARRFYGLDLVRSHAVPAHS